MPLTRLLSIILLSSLLIACGGGGSLEKTGTVGGDTGGDNAVLDTQVELNFEDRIVTANNPLEVVATVTDSDGQPVVRQEVSFTTTLGSFIPATASALTNTSGVATIELSAGSVEGAGTIVASYEGSTSKLGFYTAGDEPQSNDDAANIDIKILQNCPDSWLNIDRDSFELDPSDCSQNSNLLGQQAIVYAKITKPGSNTPASNVLVQATTTLGILLPESLTAKTDAFGVAILNLLPGSSSGVGQVELTAQGGVASALFEINAVQVNVNLSAGIATGDVLSAGSTTIITAQIVDGSNNVFTTRWKCNLLLLAQKNLPQSHYR